MVTVTQRLQKFDDLSIQQVTITVTGVATSGTGAIANFSFVNKIIDALISVSIVTVTPVGLATAMQAGTIAGNQVGLTLVSNAAGATLKVTLTAMGR